MYLIVKDLREQIRLVVGQSLIKDQVPGAAIAICINGQTFLETGIGYRDINHEISLSTDARFYIYSITKTLIATASLHLVGEGLLKLDAPVQSYCTDFPLDTSITLRHLLSHTSGLPDYGGVSAYSEAVKANPCSPWSTKVFLDLAYKGLQFVPASWVAHSVVISTASELAKIIDALFRGQILDLPLVEQMSRPIHRLGKYPLFELGYGLGLFVDIESPHGKVTGHTGEGPGYSVAAFHFPRLAGSSTTIAALVNRDKHDYGLALVYKIVHIIAEQ